MPGNDRNSSYRAPSKNGSKDASAPARRGFLDTFLAPRTPSTSSMPRIPASLLRGLVTVLGSPALLIAVPVYVLVEWLVAVALGFQGPFAVFTNALAIPPSGTAFDGSLATGIFGQQTGLIMLLVFVLLRAVVLGIVIAVTVELLDKGHISAEALRTGIRIVPTTLAVGIICMAVLTLSSLLLGSVGGIGLLLYIAALVASLYLFVFAPIVAAAEHRGMPDSLRRSIRAARMPGAGNLTLAAIYVILSLALLLAPGRPGNLIGVNPTPGAWAFVIAVNLFHLVFLAAFAFRYLSVADEVPDAPEPRPRTRRGR
jgi:hypothetical protein